MDGIGWGEAANDDGSGTALVMELARIFSLPGVQTERSIRFVLWNNEETGLQRRKRLRGPAQGPAGDRIADGFGQVPGAEVAGHDPARHDAVRSRHARAQAGCRRQAVLDAKGQPVYAPPKEQRAEADVNIEFQADVQACRRRRRSWPGSSGRPTTSTRPTTRPPSAFT